MDYIDDMMTSTEVCSQFNISLKTIQDPQRRKKMGLKAYLQKNRLYFRRSEVEAWEKHRYENDGRRYNKKSGCYRVSLVIPKSMTLEEAIEHLYNRDSCVLKTNYGFKIRHKNNQ